MPLTTPPSERIGRCTRTRRFFVRFNRSESFVHTRSSVGFTIITSGFEFSVHTPAYHPATLLKIYVYGYLNRVQSSRRLERECQRNIELVWLAARVGARPTGESLMQPRPLDLAAG
jgi:hypothetical protein